MEYFSLKRGDPSICNMDEPGGHYAKLKSQKQKEKSCIYMFSHLYMESKRVVFLEAESRMLVLGQSLPI